MIPDHDFDQLSAYLDNQLVPAEKAALEARLAAEPELRTTLRELRLTVRALRALPPVALPRSFVLTPAQAGLPAPAATKPARRPLAPALRLAATFSALALAVVVFTDLRGGFVLTASPSAEVASDTALVTDPPAEAPMEALAAVSETPAPADGTPLLEFSAEAATPDASEAGGTDATTAADEAPTPDSSAQLLPPEITPTPSAERSAATPEAEDGAGTKSAEVTETPLSVAAVAPPEATADVAGAVANDAAGAAPAPTPPGGLSSLRVVELALALLTVLLGLGAWLARRAA